MASDFNYTDTGPGEHANYLLALRKALDAGQISVSDYVSKGMPVAQEAYKLAAQLGGGGSGAADSANNIRGVLAQSGFQNKGTADDPFAVKINLPSQYQQQVRESILPPGLSPEQKAAYLNEIPQDIQIGTDQYNLEKEGLRQKIQQEQTLGKQKTARQQMLDRLQGTLNTNADNMFKRSIPTIAEDANSKGVFRSTGYGNALAKYQGELQQDTATTLGKASIESENADINTMSDIEANAEGFQTAGLQRQFSLDDFAKQKAYALDLANASKPAAPSKTNGQKWAQGADLAFKGANTAAAVGKSGGAA